MDDNDSGNDTDVGTGVDAEANTKIFVKFAIEFKDNSQINKHSN